jgi:predicted DNA-binding WGR domain protein
MPLRKVNFMPSKKKFYAVKEDQAVTRRGIGRIGSVIRRLIQSFGTSANRLTGDCHLHADDRRYDFVQNSASLAQRGTADATRERPAHRS